MNAFNKVVLRHVVGNTVVRSAGMTVNQRTHEVAYLAGGVIVMCDPSAGRQTRFITPLDRLDDTAKPRGLSCIAFSRDGTVLAAGERGRHPCVHVWTGYGGGGAQSSSSSSSSSSHHHCLRGEHRSGVSCLAISPCNRYLVSVGGRGDSIVLWAVETGTVLFKQTLETSSLVHCVTFAQDGSFFVTAGPRNLCYWSILFPPAEGSPSATISPAPVQLAGGHGEAVFVDVTCGDDGRVYAAAHSRILYVFDRSCRMTRWVNLNAKIYALALTPTCLACACSNGAVYLFDPESLACRSVLPRPHPLGAAVVAGTVRVPSRSPPPASRYPDVVACVIVQGNNGPETVVCAYSDKSLHFWPVGDGDAPMSVHNSFVAHSKAVVDIALIPEQTPSATGKTMFATTSSDGTLRFLLLSDSGVETLHLIHQASSNDDNSGGDDGDDVEEEDEDGTQVVPSYDCLDFSQQTSILTGSDEHGARSLAARPDGRHLALGGRRGRLTVVEVPTLQPIVDIAAAHTAEIVSLDYSQPTQTNRTFFLATSSNDAKVHVFYAGEAGGPNVPYARIHTIDNHRTPVTSVRFCGATRLLACSVSGSVIAADVVATKSDNDANALPYAVRPLYNVKLPLAVNAGNVCSTNDLDVSVFAGVNSNDCVFSLAVDPTLSHALVGTSSEIDVVDTATGCVEIEHRADDEEDVCCCFSNDDVNTNTYCGATATATATTSTALGLLGSIGPLVKIETDPAGMIFGTSNGDKVVRLYDLHTGVVQEKLAGHADFVSAFKFTPDCKHLITASADSCVFVWDIAPALTADMKTRLAELGIPDADVSDDVSERMVPQQDACDFGGLLGCHALSEDEHYGQKACSEDGVNDEWAASVDAAMVPARVWDDGDNDNSGGNNEGDISAILKAKKRPRNSGDISDDNDDDATMGKGSTGGDDESLLELTLKSLKTPPRRTVSGTTQTSQESKEDITDAAESIEKAQNAVDKLLELQRMHRGLILKVL